MAADGTTADDLAASDDAARHRPAVVPPPGSGDGPLIAAALETFLAERSWVVSLRHWFGEGGPFGRGDWSRERILAGIDRAVAEIDALLSAQVNAIIHAKAFQRLEATWRNARYLVGLAENAENVKIKILHITWAELCRDLERAVEFDQSQTFRKVYEDEFGMPGGEPYGLLIGDYEVRHLKSRSHPTDDIAALAGMSQVATAAFAPFIVGASPVLFGLDEF